MRSFRFLLIALSMAICCVVSAAHAADRCPDSGRPLVVLTTKVKPPDQVIADALEAHLRAELDARKIDLCVNIGASREPIGRVLLHVKRPASGPITARIWIGDAVTDKRVERTMDLSEIPPDGRPLAVAAATDELLRASWAELTIVDAPPPKMKPPEAVLTAVAESVRAPETPISARSFQLGLDGTGTLQRHRLAGGADGWAAYWFGQHLRAQLRLGIAFGSREPAADGSVRADSQSAGLGLGYALRPKAQPVGAGVDLGMSALRVEFIPDATAGAIETRTTDWAIETTAGLSGWADLGPVRANLGLLAVYAVRPTAATDQGEVVTSNEGFGGRATVGLSFWL